uniref:glucan endo-1,3-beta-D-glucosidase n=1 Tax=Noccaea caerulescens TaxID=107243 RepID=A0A1J3I6J8_NOCCA
MGIALFDDSPLCYLDDFATGLRYRNSFDMMVDAVISSMAAMGHNNLPVIVTETGWPSSGIDTSAEEDMTFLYSEMFLKGLLAHLRSGSGTPLRKEGLLEVYVFELVEEEAKGIRNSGLLHHNMTSKYSFEFSDDSKFQALPEDSKSIWLRSLWRR